MGLSEVILTGLAALCLNSTCPDNNYNNYNPILQRYQILKEQLKNDTLIITTLNNGLLSGYTDENGTLVGTGVAFDIFQILQKEYGFKYHLVKPDDDVFEPLNDGNGGVKNMLLKQNVDLAAAFLPLQYDDTVTYSRSLDTAQWVVLMKRPAESATGTGLLAPFTSTVWTLIILSLLGVGPILWLIVILRAKMCKEEEDAFTLPSCMWFVYGALLKQGSTLNPRTDSSRLLFSTWWIFITILTAFYTANLTAFLTLSKFTLPINEAKDIVQKRYKWVTNKGNGIIEELRNSRELSTGDGKSLYDMIGMPESQLDTEAASILSDYVTRRDFMYIREKTILETVMYEDYKRKSKENVVESDRCTYVITTFPVCTFPRAFAYKPGFKYQQLFDLTIEHLTESGITAYKQREFLPDTTICPLNLGSKERRLRNADLSMTYMIVGGGLIISTIIFAVELLLHYFNITMCCKKQPTLASINNNNQYKNNNVPLFTHTTERYDNKYNTTHSYNVNTTSVPTKQFKTPPPAYNSLFVPPVIPAGCEIKKKIINGRQYWVVNKKNGLTSLIPERAPSALLFQFTN